jgi:hypothetical protein
MTSKMPFTFRADDQTIFIVTATRDTVRSNSSVKMAMARRDEYVHISVAQLISGLSAVIYVIVVGIYKKEMKEAGNTIKLEFEEVSVNVSYGMNFAVDWRGLLLRILEMPVSNRSPREPAIITRFSSSSSVSPAKIPLWFSYIFTILRSQLSFHSMLFNIFNIFF